MRIVRTIILWILAIIVLLPLIMTFAASFMDAPELLEHIGPVVNNGTGFAAMPLLPGAPTLRQYVKLLLDTSKFLDMFRQSLLLVVPIVIGQVLVGTPAAWSFATYRFPFKNGLFMGCVALMMMPFQVMLVPTFLSLNALKLIDTEWAIILPGIFGTFSIFLLRQFFKSVPFELVEAARIDSAGELRIFTTIALPLSMPGVASLCILTFLDYWNMIEQPMAFLRTQDKWPLSLYLSRIGESNVDLAMSASIMTLLPTLLLFFYCESYLVRGIQMSGTKE